MRDDENQPGGAGEPGAAEEADQAAAAQSRADQPIADQPVADQSIADQPVKAAVEADGAEPAAAALPAAAAGGGGDEPDYTAETSDEKPRRIGMLIIAVVFGGFGLWSVLAPLDSAALAPGVVVVEDHRKALQHLEGGIVRDILVRDGGVVEEDEPLLVLEDTQARAELGIVTGQYLTARALVDRLKSERDGRDSVNFSGDMAVDDERAEEAMANELEIFRARREDRLGEMEVLEQRIGQLETQIDGLQAMVEAKGDVVSSLDEEIADLKALLDEGYADKQRLRELQRSRSNVLGEIADHRSAIAGARVRIGETRLEILQLNKRFITEVVDQLAEAQAQVFDLAQRKAALEDRVRRTVLRAPDSGIVLGMNAHTIGGVIKPGETVLEIVPTSTELVIDARVSPMDIDRVEVGTSADIRFSAFKNTYTIHGTLERVSADSLVDEQSGTSYYSARVRIPADELARLGGLQLLPGMPAEVFIKTGERTLFQYLITPASNMFARSLIED